MTQALARLGRTHKLKIPETYILDSFQLEVVSRLERLSDDLVKRQNLSLRARVSEYLNRRSAIFTKGLYIYGSVGRGKTMLMDAFYNDLAIEQKQRWHFHAFMQQQVHKTLKRLGQTKEQPIEILARDLSAQAKVLCFDEFHVTDIADAMILGRLFSKLFEHGTVIIATSNQKPDELYKDGLHRDRFIPFIDILKHHCDEIHLNGPTDYRRAILHKHKRYFTPNNEASKKHVDVIFKELAEGSKPTKKTLTNNGRELLIPQTANGIARLNFTELCETPLGPGDYICLADNFHTILLEQIPVMNENMHNEAKRFITLIDILYDRDINLVITAAAEPDQLYTTGKNSDFFTRTASRLIEMTGF